MSRQIQFRRGTADEHKNFTGAEGEITVDLTNKTLRVHDGVTAGGTMLARQSTLDAADYVVASYRAPDGNVWWRKYKSGSIDIGGYYTGNAQTVTLPVELADNNYTVCLHKNSSPAYWATTHLVIEKRTTTSFTVSVYGDKASMCIGWTIIGAKSK